MNREHVAPRAIEPGEHDDLAAHPQIANAFGDAFVEHQPGVRRSFIALSRSGAAVDQGRLDRSDGLYLVIS